MVDVPKMLLRHFPLLTDTAEHRDAGKVFKRRDAHHLIRGDADGGDIFVR